MRRASRTSGPAPTARCAIEDRPRDRERGSVTAGSSSSSTRSTTRCRSCSSGSRLVRRTGAPFLGLAQVAFALAIGSALIACRDDATGVDPAVENGSRLVAERWVADGIASFARWHDSELGMSCEFQMAADGRVRCLPTEALASGYADSACTQPAVYASTTCSDVRFATHAGRVFSVGAPLTAGFVIGGELPCTRDLNADRAYFAAGEPVPLDTFVGADVLAPGSALVTTEYRGEDGSRQRVPLTGGRGQGVSRAVDMECVIRLTGRRTADCTFPSAASSHQTHYLDAACTVPVIEPQGFPSQLAIAYFARPCAPTPLYQLGESRSVPNVFYRNASGTCTSLAIIGTMVFDIAPIDNANVSLALEIDETSTTRLRQTTWVTATGERWPGPLFDSTLDAPCVPRADGVGHARCVPALNETFAEQVDASTSSTCEASALVSASCWGQSIRAEQASERSACGYALFDFRQAIGEDLDAPHYTASRNECGPIDLAGAQLRAGTYGATDAAEFVEMRLER